MTEPQPPAQEPRRKTGFFSRLFSLRDADQAAADASVDGDDQRLNEYLPMDSSVEVPLEQPVAEEKKGLLSRWFGRKDAAPAEEPPPAPDVAADAKPSWFRRLTERLGKTRRSIIDNVKSVIGLSGRLDAETIEEIEAILIQSDVAVETTAKIIAKMKAEAKRREKEMGPGVLLDIFKEAVRDILRNAAPGFDPKPSPGQPYVVMVVGVNGVGKTTTIAKMAKRCTAGGLKTMLVAGDTFRAAAVEQLEIWAGRTGCEFMRAPHGADAASLCFDATQRAKARGMDVVFIDTAGRLQNKGALMDELGKIERVIRKHIPEAPHETLLILDATTGQNALQQVKIFSETVRITGLVMTKLDGTAKGGVLLSILDMFRIPITLIGVGESADDLRDFDPDQFAAALFGEEEKR